MTGETRKTEFSTSTGEKLAAARELPRGAPRAYALFAHCFSCSKDIKAAREVARALRAEGYAVLRFVGMPQHDRDILLDEPFDAD